MKITLAVLADAANTSAEDKLNMLGVFQVINAPSVPCQHPQCTLVLMFRCDIGEKDSEHEVTIRLIDPDAKEIIKFAAEFEVKDDGPMPNPVFPLVMNIQRLTFHHFGHHIFEIYIDGQKSSEIDLLVAPSFGKKTE